jgi:RNA polymerase sigma factor (sigma-70 family)
MTTERQPVHSAVPRGCSDERWRRTWSHREQLLRVARRRSASAEDAEDAVQEAMLRAVENTHVEDERLGAWLTTVTMRLCVDRHRQLSREAEVGNRSILARSPSTTVEEEVCDRAEARWLAGRSGDLPARQAEALWLKAEDLDVGQVARKMGLSYRTVESLLARARRTLRNALAGTLALALWVCGRGRSRTGGSGQVTAAVSTAATLAAVGLALPVIHEVKGPHQPQSTRHRSVGTTAYDRATARSSGRSTASQRPIAPRAAPRDGQFTDVLAVLPQVSVPALPPLPTLGAASPPSLLSVLRVVSPPSLPTTRSTPAGTQSTAVPSLPDGSSGSSAPAASSDTAVPGIPAEAGLPTGTAEVPTVPLGKSD